MCNVSVVQADSNPPTECRISINNNSLYTNNRYVTLDLYGVDADQMQVWVSNDGENGTILDFAYGTTYTITDQNYVVGVALDSSNSSTSTNTDNVLRIVDWPLSSVNGTKKIYAVFRDSFGNSTSTTGLSTITISFDLNGLDSDAGAPASITTVKNLGAYMPNVVSSAVNQSFVGWSTSTTGSLPNYNAYSIQGFEGSTTLYAVKKTVNVGDYLYYTIDKTKKYKIGTSTSGYNTEQVLDNSTKFSNEKQKFKVIQSSASSIVISPMKSSQVYSFYVGGWDVGEKMATMVSTVAGLYATNYSSKTAVISDSLMKSVSTDSDFASLFNANGYTGEWGEDSSTQWRYVNVSKIGSYSAKLQIWHVKGTEPKSACVYPVITLNDTVRFSGPGTTGSPYEIFIP